MNGLPPTRIVLRELPLPARLVIATFLIAVGLGYFAALVQLHLQNAAPGRLLPSDEDAVKIYYGRPQVSQLERLLEADANQPFNGSGSMRPAFFERSSSWERHIRRRAEEKKENPRQAEAELREEREGERQAILAWIRGGVDRQRNDAKAYEADRLELPPALAGRPLTPEFLERAADGKGRAFAKIKSILESRCVRCHSEGAGGAPAQFPLESYEQVEEYCNVQGVGGGMSLRKLAQSTHVHLLSFAMLYALTGLAFAFTSYPVGIRVVVAPLALVAQVVDVSCWWLARSDPLFARAIVVTGGVVGFALFAQILGTLFNLFGRAGRVVLILLLLAGGAAGYVVKERVIVPYLAEEAKRGAAPE